MEQMINVLYMLRNPLDGEKHWIGKKKRWIEKKSNKNETNYK